MFKFFRTPIFFDADDGAGSGEPLAPGADPSLGSPSPTEQHFESGQDFRDARQALLRDPPPVIDVNAPEPAPAADPLESAVADLTTPAPGAPAAPAPAAPAPAAPAAPQLITVGYTDAGVPVQITPEQAAQHWQVDQALRTEAGVRAMVAQGLRALYPNASAEQIRTLSEQLAGAAPESAPGAAPAADPLAGIADDDLVTGEQLKNIVATLVGQAAQQAAAQTQQLVQAQVDPVKAAFEQQQQRTAQVAADNTYVELLGALPPEGDPAREGWLRQAKAVQVAASAFLADDNWNPADIRAALLRGHAVYTQEQDQLLRAYAAGKKRDREAQPTSIKGGQATGSEPAPEPKNMAEARAAAKAEGFFK